MEYRLLGASGLKVPALSLGTGTFGGRSEFFNAWGATDVSEATRLVDICLDAGLNMFDSADVYSAGAAEEILGQATRGRRDQVLLSTKATFRTGGGPNDATQTVMKYIVDSAFKGFLIGYANAIAVVVFAIVLAITLLQNWFQRVWVHYD